MSDKNEHRSQPAPDQRRADERRSIAGPLAITICMILSGISVYLTAMEVGQNLVIDSTRTAPNVDCPQGGSLIEWGVDADGDGVLTPDEVGARQPICDGRNGSPGASGFDGANGEQGPPGMNGTDGSDGLNGSDGVNGTDGVNGASAPVQLVLTIPLDVLDQRCSEGGTEVRFGHDMDQDGILDTGEVTTTTVICDGEHGTGADAWVSMSNIPAWICADGMDLAFGVGAAPADVNLTLCPESTGNPLTDISPGNSNSITSSCSAGNFLHSHFIFTAYSSGMGCELWSLAPNGTSTMVANLHPSGDAFPGRELGFVFFDDHLWFDADDGSTGRELWRTDGTTEGTQRVTDLNPFGSAVTMISWAHVLGDHLILALSDGATGTEPWRIDGANGSLVRVQDHRPGAASSIPGATVLIPFGERLILDADDGTHGRELHALDANGSLTLIIDGDGAGDGLQGAVGVAVLDDRLVMVFDDGIEGRELWLTDGTQAGTQRLTNHGMGADHGFPSSSEFGLMVVNGLILTVDDDGSLVSVTEAGVVEVLDATRSDLGATLAPVSDGTEVVYACLDPSQGVEVCRSDGTATGTGLLLDLHPGAASSDPSHAYPSPSGWIIIAEGEVGGIDTGHVAWRFTESGAELVLRTDTSGDASDLGAALWITHSEGFLTSGHDGTHGTELWSWTDGVRQPMEILLR